MGAPTTCQILTAFPYLTIRLPTRDGEGNYYLRNGADWIWRPDGPAFTIQNDDVTNVIGTR